jgi:hypothetical protein
LTVLLIELDEGTFFFIDLGGAIFLMIERHSVGLTPKSADDSLSACWSDWLDPFRDWLGGFCSGETHSGCLTLSETSVSPY